MSIRSYLPIREKFPKKQFKLTMFEELLGNLEWYNCRAFEKGKMYANFSRWMKFTLKSVTYLKWAMITRQWHILCNYIHSDGLKVILSQHNRSSSTMENYWNHPWPQIIKHTTIYKNYSNTIGIIIIAIH